MSNFNNSNWWQDIKPAIIGFTGLFLIITSAISPFTLTSFFPGAEGIVISSATSLASGLTGVWLYWKFRKSE
jgi:hypothetical protein